MDRWLGDGGHAELIGTVGGAFDGYGVDGEDLGWVAGTFTPTDLACNPHGIVQAGIHGLLLDARHELRHQRRPARAGPDPGHARDEDRDACAPPCEGDAYALRGEVVRMARQVAYGEATVHDADGLLVSRSTGTFLLHRPDDGPPGRLTGSAPRRSRPEAAPDPPARAGPTRGSAVVHPEPIRLLSTATARPAPRVRHHRRRVRCADGRSPGPARSASAAG